MHETTLILDNPRVAGPAPAEGVGDGLAPPPPLRDVERAHVARVLDYAGWNKTRASRLLGISRPTLDKKIKKYGLLRPEPTSARRPGAPAGGRLVPSSSSAVRESPAALETPAAPGPL